MMKLVQPYDGLLADPAIFIQVGNSMEWLINQATVDAWKFLAAMDGYTDFTTPVGHGVGAGMAWPVARESLKMFSLRGPAPADPDAGPTGGGNTRSTDFMRQVK
jgi:hypothetical protein